MTSAETALTVLGGLLVLGALVSGIARRSFLSLTALFVLAGFALGQGGAGVLEFDATGDFVADLWSCTGQPGPVARRSRSRTSATRATGPARTSTRAR